MFEKLNKEEEIKVKDFMNIYKKDLNPNGNQEIDTIIDCTFDTVIKVYMEYKKRIPFVSTTDDNYGYYILRPINGKYSLLDYLINTVIQNLDAIELVNDQTCCNYNFKKKKMYINKQRILLLHPSVFDARRKPIDKDKYLELYYKNVIYHEIGHMLHDKIDTSKENTIYVPLDYLSLSDFPPLPKRMSRNVKKVEMEKRNVIAKERAREKMKKKITMYSVLQDKYSILNPNEIDDCYVETREFAMKYEEIIAPPFLYLNPVDEAFTECDAQVYSGMFENPLFDIDGELECFYLPIDYEHILMTYAPSSYSFSASIGFALKRCISKEAYFRTVFLGKKDLFIEFLGKYDLLPVRQFANQLMSADKGEIDKVQPLLDSIVEFSKKKGISLAFLNIYFPLIYKENKCLYYTDAIHIPPKVFQKEK